MSLRSLVGKPLALAAMLSMLVVACGSSASTPTASSVQPTSAPATIGNSGSTPTQAMVQPTTGGTTGSGGAASLTGAGSTFVNPFFSQAFAQYSKDNPGVRVNYQSIGSGGGIQQFTAKTVDFGASDVPMNSDELTAAKAANGDVVEIPDALGATAIVYNLPGLKSGLKLSGDLIAQIYMGKITKWNDPSIKKLNSGMNLPDQDITVVHRSDGSGTTYIFTDYLSNVSPAWKNGPGTSKEIDWPTGVGGKGSEGVAAQVQQAPGGIGYVELAYALQTNMSYASIQNKAGKFVAPSLDATTAAAGEFPNVSPDKFSIVNAPGDGSYPIAGYSWAIFWKTYGDQSKAQALVSLFKWVTSDAQDKFAKPLSYAPLPQNARQLAAKQLGQITSK